MSLRLAALLVVSVSCRFAAAVDTGPTSYVDLPEFRAEGAAAKVVIAKPVAGDPATLTLALLNPAPAPKGALEGYEVTADPATKTWRVEAVAKTKQRKPVGKLAVEGDALTFQWETGVIRSDGGALRNCVLTIGGTSEQSVALRNPIRLEKFPLDFSKDFSRIALPDDLPDESQIQLAVDGVRDIELTPEVSAQTAGMKQAILVDLKKTEEAVPGIRLRIVLWKAGLKPELIIRSEMVAAKGAVTESAAPPPGTVVVRPAGDGDPTKPSAENPSFTTRSLTALKSAVTRQLQAAKTQIRTDQTRLIAGQKALGDFDLGTEDPTEQAQIGQLQSAIGALTMEIQTLETQMIPSLEKQFAAFEPLEKLRASLNGKGTAVLRIFYDVGGKQVNVLTMGEAEAK